MKSSLKFIEFEWKEEFEDLHITTKPPEGDGDAQSIVLRRGDIFPLVRFCLRLIQKYFVTGLKTKKRRNER